MSRAIYGDANDVSWKITYANGSLAFVLGDQTVSFGAVAVTEPWHHVAFSCDKMSDGVAVRLWLDYELVAERAVVADLRSGCPSQIVIGSEGLSAILDEMRFLAGVCDASAFLRVPRAPGLLLIVR